jgi:hypothetical protein
MPEYVVGQRVRVKDGVLSVHVGKVGTITHISTIHRVASIELTERGRTWEDAFLLCDLEPIPEEVNHD